MLHTSEGADIANPVRHVIRTGERLEADQASGGIFGNEAAVYAGTGQHGLFQRCRRERLFQRGCSPVGNDLVEQGGK